jgi:hypothetical protein
MMKKTSEEARRRYTEYIQEYKAFIEEAQERERAAKVKFASDGEGAGLQKLALAGDNLDVVAHYLLMNSLSVSLLGIRNEAFLNEARKSCYKAVIWLEEVVTPLIDAPFSEYEEALAAIEGFSDASRYDLLRKLGFAIDAIEEGYGDNSKWKWSFVELEGRFAAVTRNLLNLKTLLAGMDPRVEGYDARLAHLALARELLQQAADRYRQKYEMGNLRVDDIKAGINFLSALRRLHVVLGEGEQAEVVRKKAEIWKSKMEDDLRKAEQARKV